MASKKLPVISVAVCGLTSSSFTGMSGQGAGKSCLCNRFVRPKRDDLCLNHSSIMTNSDFGSSVVNNIHFLYWGEKVAALEDGSVAFQVVEHTEFMEDGNLQLYPILKPYHKRCIQQKLVSGGKVQYLHPDQLAVPDEYTNVGRFPEKFLVDGYIICVDVSEDLSHPQSMQREFLGRLLPAIMSVKKTHVVVAYTKFDIARESSVVAANEILSRCKRQLTVVEVSALEGVNVDVCFLVLAHLVDSKRPRTRISSFAAAYAHLKERVRKNEESFQAVLSARIIDFSLPLSRARALLENEVEFLVLRELRGKERVDRLIRAQLKYLKEGVVKAKMTDCLDNLRASLEIFLPELSLNDTLESCKNIMKSHDKFSAYFTENPDWRDDVEFLKQAHVTHVPVSFLDELEGIRVLEQHMDKLLASQREEAACEVIVSALASAQKLMPGSSMEDVVRGLGLGEQLNLVPSHMALQVFQERMAVVEQECVSDVTDLLLEHPHLFSLSEENVLSTINTQLKDDRRYQRLELHAGSRTSAIIKFIGVMKWPDKGPYAVSHILEAHTLRGHGTPSQQLLSQIHGLSDQTDDGSSRQSNWTLNPESTTFNLAILGRTEENALTLRSDFMNHMSGSGVCEVLGSRYLMQLTVHHGNVTALHSHTSSPQGAVAVVNSVECLSWLEETLHSLWIPGEDRTSPYRGLPLVILALDDSIMHTDASSINIPDTQFCRRAKQLADSVQCVLMVERPTVQPKRLVLTSVISPLLSSLVDSVTSYSEFLSYNLSYNPKALNVAVFTLAGDPYSPLDLLSPWLRHQAVCTNEKGKSLFINCPLERQHSVMNLTFYSSLNVLDVKKKVHAGFMLVYSPHRPASLAILKHLLSQLPPIPMMIVAMVTGESCDNRMIEEGEKLAEQNRAMFMVSNTPKWQIGCTTQFFSKCWFSRFTSWQTQNFNPRGNRDRPLPQPVPGNHSPLTGSTESSSVPPPSVPAPLPLLPHPSHNLSRPHSISGLLDPPLSPPSRPSRSSLISPPPYLGTMPRAPRNNKASSGKWTEEEEEEEEVVYSSPVDIAMGSKQKRATLQRRQEREHTLPRVPSTPQTGPLSPNQHLLMMHLQGQSNDDEDKEYAEPKDMIKFASGSTNPAVTPEGGPLRSPSVSPPPPPPISPPITNGRTEEGEELYDTVQPSSQKTAASNQTVPGPPRRGSYDHLKRQTSYKYDRLTENEGAGGEGERPPAPLPNEPPQQPAPLPEYATVGLERVPGNLYATVGSERHTSTPDPQETRRNRTGPPVDRGTPHNKGTDKSRKNKTITIVPVAGGNSWHGDNKRPPIPSPSAVAHGNTSETSADNLYSVANTSAKKRNRTPPPPVLPKPHPPVNGGGGGGGSSPPTDLSRRSLERQRKPTKPLVGSIGGHARHKSNELDLSTIRHRTGSSEHLSPHHHQQQLTQHYHPPTSSTEELYAMPLRKNRKPPVVAPKPRQVPSPIPPNAPESRFLPRGKSFDLEDPPPRTSPQHRVRSPQLERSWQHSHPPPPLPDRHMHKLDSRMRTVSDPFFNQTVRERAQQRGKVAAGYGKRAESSEDVWRGEGGWGGGGGDDVDSNEPVLPERRYSPAEMGLEDEPPPLPPRNYDWSDVEDNDEDLFQSEDELEEPSSRISLDDQQAMYSSLRLYQKKTNSMSGIEELYAIVNQVAEEQEATQKPNSQSIPAQNEEANVYDTLESALKQKEHLKVKSEVTAAMRTGSGGQGAEKPHQRSTPLGVLGRGGPGGTMFTPKQLKLIKQQQKLLDKLQKKTEREAERRRRSEVRRKRSEESRRKGKKSKNVKEPEQQRYFGSPLEKVVEADGVPRFIKQCTQIIEEKGIKVEGMYRVSGKKDVCLALQDQYDMDSQLDVAGLGLCETAISSTLKAFFKLLPEPLIPNTVASAILDINEMADFSEQKVRLEEILQQMPGPNLSTLRYFMFHLHRVQGLRDVNKMSSSNLAIVFWPTLMRPPLADLADPSKQLCWQLMMARLIEHPHIVPEVC